MIKRRRYAHSRWGREYRLTPPQVAAIVDDLAPGPLTVPALIRRGRPVLPSKPARQRVQADGHQVTPGTDAVPSRDEGRDKPWT